MDINFIVHLRTFFFLARNDNRLSTSHLSLYVALFDAWNSHRFKTPFYPSRSYLMATSRIGSNTTYAKTMEELHRFGYIRQEKQNRFGQSQVTVLQLPTAGKSGQLPLFDNPSLQEKEVSASPELVPERHAELERDDGKKGAGEGVQYRTRRVQNDTHRIQNHVPRIQYCTPCVPNLYPIIYKHINIKKNGSKQAPAPDFSFKNFFSEEKQTEGLPAAQNCTPRLDDCQHPESNTISNLYPSLYETQRFFMQLERYQSSLKQALEEAEKFFNHYTAIGWKLGGVNPIQDWKAAARKWVLNNWRHDNPHAVASRQQVNGNKQYDHPF